MIIFHCLILNTFNIREKVKFIKKRQQKNLPNVGGENAAKVTGKISAKMKTIQLSHSVLT